MSIKLDGYQLLDGSWKEVSESDAKIGDLRGRQVIASDADPQVLALAMQMIKSGGMVAISSGERVIQLPGGHKYYGSIDEDGQPHGIGKLEYSGADEQERMQYEGAFVHGLQQGQGRLTWRNRRTYVGEWYQGQRHGQGKESYTDQYGFSEVYVGHFEHNLRQGQGKLSCRDSHSRHTDWEGTFKKGKLFTGKSKSWISAPKYAGEADEHIYVNGEKDPCCIIL